MAAGTCGLDRRRFVGGCAALAAAGALPGCAGLAYVPTRLERDRLVFERAAFGEHRCVGLDHPRLAVPIAVCRLDDGTLSAVAAQCTHKRCDLRPAGNRLECPCHGSEFALTGEVLKDPATENLRRFAVTSDERYVYVGG